MLLCLLSSLCIALLASAAPTSVLERAGPSGKLLEPYGGQTFRAPGSMRIVYQRVHKKGFSTLSIQADVEELDSPSEKVLINALEAGNKRTDDKIEAYISVPEGVCGNMSFVVFETQQTPSGVFTFLAAAPAVHFICPAGSTAFFPPAITDYSGPHGKLLSPFPGSKYTNKGGAGVAIHFQYKRLVSKKATTISARAELDQGYGGYVLAFELQSCDFGTGPVIDAYFGASDAYTCGTFNFTVYENQMYNGEMVTFLTAQVPLTIDCPCS